MTLQVIGAGLGRTGTLSLKLALTQLGLGPCHHMTEIMANFPVQLPMWTEAVDGRPDWAAIYQGFTSAVDWPTASYYKGLSAFYPQAKFILTVRSTESWLASFSGTIFEFWKVRDQVSPEIQPWLDMFAKAANKVGITKGMDAEALGERFEGHIAAVKAEIPADRLLTYQVKEGWGPLCAFLGKPIPAEAFPRTNDRAHFWELVGGKQ